MVEMFYIHILLIALCNFKITQSMKIILFFNEKYLTVYVLHIA